MAALQKKRTEAVLMTVAFIIIASLSLLVDYRLALAFIPLILWVIYRIRMNGSTVQSVGLNELLDQCLNQAIEEEAERHPQFTFTLTKKFDTSITKRVSSSQDFAQIFIQHFSNALSSMRHKKELRGMGYSPEIDVRTSNYKGYVEIIIRDNGLGITDAIAQNLFQSFQGKQEARANLRAHDIITHTYHGTIRVESIDGEYFQLIVTFPQ